MPLTLTLADPPRAALPDAPTRLDPAMVAPLARALNTVVYGYVDEDVDGSPEACEDLWLTDIAAETMSLALLHLFGNADPLASNTARVVQPLLAYAFAEQRLLDLVREGPEGPALRIAEDDGPVDPRGWTYRRMGEALALAGCDMAGKIHGSDLALAANRIGKASIETRAGRDVARLGQFAETLMLWNDHPVLVCRPAAEADKTLALEAQFA